MPTRARRPNCPTWSGTPGGARPGPRFVPRAPSSPPESATAGSPPARTRAGCAAPRHPRISAPWKLERAHHARDLVPVERWRGERVRWRRLGAQALDEDLEVAAPQIGLDLPGG